MISTTTLTKILGIILEDYVKENRFQIYDKYQMENDLLRVFNSLLHGQFLVTAEKYQDDESNMYFTVKYANNSSTVITLAIKAPIGGVLQTEIKPTIEQPMIEPIGELYYMDHVYKKEEKYNLDNFKI